MSRPRTAPGRCYLRRMADTHTPTTEQITPLQARCISLHEYHEALKAAGFTPAEAMTYLIGVTRRTDSNGS